MPDSILNTRWVPQSMYRTRNVEKFEAMTGRLIWRRTYQIGNYPFTPKDIVPIHGTPDLAACMNSSYLLGKGGTSTTDWFFRIPDCGGQENSCIPWSIRGATANPPLAASSVYIQRELMFGAANGTTYTGNDVQGLLPDDGTRIGLAIWGPPITGIPSTSDFYVRGDPAVIIINDVAHSYTPVYRLGPAGLVWTRPVISSARYICANEAGDVLYTFGAGAPYTGDGTVTAGGCVVMNGAGAGEQITYDDAIFYFRVVVTPTSVTLLDNSIIASHYDNSILLGHPETVDPTVCRPHTGCSRFGRWYVHTCEKFAPAEPTNTIRCYSAALDEIVWETAIEGLGGGSGTSAGAYKMFADDSGIYVVSPCVVGGATCSLVKLDHDGEIIYGLSTLGVSGCLDSDEKYLYLIG